MSEIATPTAMLTAVAYTRLSQDRDGLMRGVQRQEEDCRAHASRRGWTINYVYCDDDLSAFTGKPRPGYRDLLGDMRAGLVKRLVVYDVDRLVRRMRELVEFIDIVTTYNIEVATVTGDIDLSTGTGRFMAHIMGAKAEMESEDRIRRIRRAALQAAREGKLSGGGTRPFGRQADGVAIEPTEAAIVRELARRVLGGESLASLCEDLTRRGVPTVTGKPWRPTVLRRMLLSGRTAGVRVHHGEVTADLVGVDPILQRQQWDRLRVLLTAPARRLNDGQLARKYLLTGLLYCGREECGAKLVARPKGDGRRGYVCSGGPNFNGCGKIGRLADPVEELVAEVVLQACERPSMLAALRRAAGGDQRQAELHAQLEADRLELAELDHRAYVTRDLPKPRYAPLAAALGERMERTLRALRAMEGASILAEIDPATVRKEWERHPMPKGLAWRRALVAAVCERITVLPATKGRNTFDPSRIQPKLRAEAE